MSYSITTQSEIRDHFLQLKGSLRSSPQELADMLGVARQTIYQYGFEPGARGARTISAASIDVLRIAAVEHNFEHSDRHFPAFRKRSEATWIVGGFETTCRGRAVYLAGVQNADIRPHADNAERIALSTEEISAIRWLSATRCRNVHISALMEITGLGEYDIGRVGIIWPHWGIVPEKVWIEALEARFQETHNAA